MFIHLYEIYRPTKLVRWEVLIQITTPSRFLMKFRRATNTRAHVISDVKLNFCEYDFLLAISLQNRAMNGMNEKIQESHECKRQLRLQRQREKLARLDCDTKDQCERTLQLRRDREKNRRAGDTRQEKEQLRLQRRREHKRARAERYTPDQFELRHQAQRRRSQVSGLTDECTASRACKSCRKCLRYVFVVFIENRVE